MKTIPTKRISQADCAKKLKIHRSTLNKKIKALGIPVDRNGKVDFQEVQKFIKDTKDPARQKEKKNGGGLVFAAERARKEHFRSRIVELEFLEKVCKVHNGQECEQKMLDKELAIKSAFLNMVHDLPPRLIGKGIQEIHAILKSRVFEICHSLGRRGQNEKENQGGAVEGVASLGSHLDQGRGTEDGPRD